MRELLNSQSLRRLMPCAAAVVALATGACVYVPPPAVVADPGPPGTVVVPGPTYTVLPVGARPLVYRGVRCYYYRGVYYRRHPRGHYYRWYP